MTPAEALQAWLALEHEAVWFYPVVGGRFDDLRQQATASFKTHRDTRDGLLTRVRVLGAEPVTAELTYDVGALASVDEARAAAQAVEARISAATLAVAGVTEDDLRTYAVRGLTRAALAGLAWGAEPTAFPGLP